MLALLLLLLTPPYSFWKEKEHCPALKLEEKLRTGRLMHGGSSDLITGGAKSLGSR